MVRSNNATEFEFEGPCILFVFICAHVQPCSRQSRVHLIRTRVPVQVCANAARVLKNNSMFYQEYSICIYIRVGIYALTSRTDDLVRS